MTMLFAAVHESGCGTKRTWRDVRLESAMRTKGNIVVHIIIARPNARRGRSGPA